MKLLDYYSHIDTGELRSNASCYVVGTNTIYAYYNNNRIREEYHLINDQLFLYYTSNYNYNYDVSNYHCVSYKDIQNIRASNDWVMPFYYGFALFCFVVLVYSAYRLILYPWFSRL